MYLKKQHFIDVLKQSTGYSADDFWFQRHSPQCATLYNNGRSLRMEFEPIRLNGLRFTILHNTIIVARRYSKVTLNTGGWYTVTTKKRINEQLRGYYIQQKDFNWYLIATDGIDATRVPFREGMTIID